jgi:hypothetical protein
MLAITFLGDNMVLTFLYGFGSLNETAESASALTLRLWKPMLSNDYLDYLGEFESISKTALAHESGSKGESFMLKKKPTVKNLMSLSF